MKKHIPLEDYCKIKSINSKFKTKSVVTTNYDTEVEVSENTATFIITTPNIDRSCDIVVTSGLNTDNYMKNPVVLWMHDDTQLPIGKCVSLYKSSDGIIATVQFADFDTPAVGEKAAGIFSLIKQGILNAVSIGFQPLENIFNEFGGQTITSAELVEFSIVNVPCNSDCLITDYTEQKSLDTTSTPVVAQDYAGDQTVELPTAIEEPEVDSGSIPEEYNNKEKQKRKTIAMERARRLRLLALSLNQ